MASIISDEKYSLYYQRIGLIYQRPEIRASLEVVMSVFTVMILIFAAIRPTLTNIASLQKKIEDQEVLNKKADNKIAQLFNAQTQLSTYEDQLDLYDAAIPNSYSYYDMAGRIEYLASKHGVTVESINMPGTKIVGSGKPLGDWATKLLIKDANNILTSGMNFTVAGNPQNVIAMITEIENLDRLTLLRSVDFSKELRNSSGTEILKATGQIYFYFYQSET